jgi:hypothetical protein
MHAMLCTSVNIGVLLPQCVIVIAPWRRCITLSVISCGMAFLKQHSHMLDVYILTSSWLTNRMLSLASSQLFRRYSCNDTSAYSILWVRAYTVYTVQSKPSRYSAMYNALHCSVKPRTHIRCQACIITGCLHTSSCWGLNVHVGLPANDGFE